MNILFLINIFIFSVFSYVIIKYYIMKNNFNDYIYMCQKTESDLKGYIISLETTVENLRNDMKKIESENLANIRWKNQYKQERDVLRSKINFKNKKGTQK